MQTSIGNSRRNWPRLRRTSFWPQRAKLWRRCNWQHAPYRSCLRMLSIRFGAGFVDSLPRPGGNATGFVLFEYSISAKWLELLKEIAPGVTRAAVLRDPAIAAGTGQFGAIQSVAPSLGV